MFIIISITMSRPRQLAFDVSPCQTGAVDVLRPLPIPATILGGVSTYYLGEYGLTYLPTIICAVLKADICKIAPMLMIVVPRRIVFFRPRISPTTKAPIAPKKQPTSIRALVYSFWRLILVTYHREQ